MVEKYKGSIKKFCSSSKEINGPRHAQQASYLVTMRPLVAHTDDLISVLDRVLDKGIVLESWARLSLQESGLVSVDSRIPSGSRISVESSAVYIGYGNRGAWREDSNLEHLFPYWRRDLWRK